MVAMSPSLKLAPLARIGNTFRSSTELNWPPTRTCRKSVGAVDDTRRLDRVLLAELGDHGVEVEARAGPGASARSR
jgi:hypothetical protein